MATRARQTLERIALLGRGLALALGAIVGGQAYARGSGAPTAILVGCAAGAAAYAALWLLLRRSRRYVEASETEVSAPGPRRRARRRSRRVLRGSGE